jgi:predicted nucleic acid-binding Zn ribbon protein
LKKHSNSENSRQADIVSLKDGITALLKAYRLQGKINEVMVVSSWERIMGKAVALKTQEVYINQGKLFVRLSSAPLKHELVMAKTRVLELINAEVGEKVIQEVVFLSPYWVLVLAPAAGGLLCLAMALACGNVNTSLC